MVGAIRACEQALGRVRFEPTEEELASRRYRRSLFVVEDVRAGETMTEKNIRSIRPADGLPPKCLPQVLGKKASRDIRRGTPLAWDMLG
jgi:N-acetylneuraminate synthase